MGSAPCLADLARYGAPWTQTSAALVRGLRITDDGRVLLGEECHSDPHFFLIFLDDRLQVRSKLLFLLTVVLRVVDVAAYQPHEFHILHTNSIPSPATVKSILLRS